MPENNLFLPEGLCLPSQHSLSELKTAAETGEILTAPVLRCDTAHTLHVALNGIRGEIPRSEAVATWVSGSSREITVLSRVGKPSCFTVKEVVSDKKGAPVAHLSRAAAQERAMEYFLSHLKPGMILTCQVTHLEHFGAFLDIGCGIIAMLPVERISVSRITHPRERFRIGQRIPAIVHSIDPLQRRITMTHKELLGNWMENASVFQCGETVQGIVRSVMEYGSFIELTPNLSGLSDARDGLSVGDGVSVYIKSIQPERMKIKLQVIEKLADSPAIMPLRYQITDGTLERWEYAPDGCKKASMVTDFTASDP